MTDDSRSRLAGSYWSWAALLAAVVPGCLLAGYYEWRSWSPSGAGFPLDDAWIHAQFARNLASGLGFSYTGPEWVAGSTAPLWTLVLAGFYAAYPDMVVIAKAVGVVCQVLTGLATADLVWRLTESRAAALGAACAAAALPVMVWGAMSGMEVTLSALLAVAGLAAYARAVRSEHRLWPLAAFALLSLSCLARPENAAVVGIVLLHYVISGHVPKRWPVRLAAGLAVATVVMAPSIWLSEASIGRPLPTTFYAKSGPGLVRAIEAGDSAMVRRNVTVFGPRAVSQFAATLVDQLGWAAWLVPLGAGALIVSRHWRTGLLLATLTVAVPYAMGLLAPQRLKPDNVRYVPQLVVLCAALSFTWLGAVTRRAPRAAGLLATLVASVIFVQAWQKASQFALGVTNINQLHVTLGRWVHDHLPDQAVIAANDVGALAYFGGRRILDIEGLVTPAALAYRGRPERGLAFVRDTRPDFVAIFPHWYPEIPRHKDLFTEVHRVTISDNVVAAGSTIIVYQTAWARRGITRSQAMSSGHESPRP